MKRAHIPRRNLLLPGKPRNLEIYAKVIAMREARYSFKEIGERLGFSKQRAHQIWTLLSGEALKNVKKNVR